MFFIEKTSEFDKWLRKLKDLKAKAKILLRIQQIESKGHFGDCKPIGNIESISKKKTGKLLSCWLVEINHLNKKTLKRQKKSGINYTIRNYGNYKI